MLAFPTKEERLCLRAVFGATDVADQNGSLDALKADIIDVSFQGFRGCRDELGGLGRDCSNLRESAMQVSEVFSQGSQYTYLAAVAATASITLFDNVPASAWRTRVGGWKMV